MKVYLSSYRLGHDATTLREMVTGGRRVGVIRNALDFSTDPTRLEESMAREFAEMRSLELVPEDLDLKDYFDPSDRLEVRLDALDALWVVGGNAFILRRAMQQSRLDELLTQRKPLDFVYAGYSAGACVVSATLKGIEHVDPIDVVPAGYPEPVIWEGIGLVPFAIAPHYQSDHPDSRGIEQSVAYYDAHNIPFVALRDGEVYVADISP